MNDKKILIAALAAVTLIAALGFIRRGPTVVEATEFRLVDSDGSVARRAEERRQGRPIGLPVREWRTGDHYRRESRSSFGDV